MKNTIGIKKDTGFVFLLHEGCPSIIEIIYWKEKKHSGVFFQVINIYSKMSNHIYNIGDTYHSHQYGNFLKEFDIRYIRLTIEKAKNDFINYKKNKIKEISELDIII